MQIRVFAWVGTLATTVLAFAALAHVQTSRGTVTRTVLDSSGAVVWGARLILTGTETGLRLLTESNEAGIYRFDALDPGVYDLTVAHSGFKSYVVPVKETSQGMALRHGRICWFAIANERF